MKFLGILFFIFLSLHCWANTQRAYLAPSAIYRKYSEDLSAGKSDELGWLYGFQAGYDLIESQFFYFGSDIRFYSGRNRYNGSVKNVRTGVIRPFTSHTDNTILNIEGRIGYTGYVNGWKLVPFLGMGYFKWDREAVDRKVGYDEIYTWLYFAAGLRIDKRISTRFKMGAIFKAMHMQNADIEVRNLFAFPVRAKLGNCFQYEASVPLTYRISNHLDMSFVLMYCYRKIGASQKQKIGSTTFFEPTSYAQEGGLRVEIGYLF